MRIALLEDDDAQIKMLVSTLRKPLVVGDLDNKLSTFLNGEEMRRALRLETFDVLILDWHVPGLDGLDLLRWLRRERADRTPVLMLSQMTGEQDIALALGLGADDYVQKPFRPLELRARLSRLVQRYSSAHSKTASVLNFEGWSLNSSDNKVIYDAGNGLQPEVCFLTEREFKFTATLFANVDRTVSRSHLLLASGYYSDEMISRALDIHIYRIRKKLKLNGDRGLIIRAVYGRGYRLLRT